MVDVGVEAEPVPKGSFSRIDLLLNGTALKFAVEGQSVEHFEFGL